MDKRNILVTGGAGFIGSFLCESLLKDGHRVICVDNVSTGHVRNIEGLLRNPDFQFIRLDIVNPFNLEEYDELKAFKVPFDGIQEIYHLAMPTAVKQYEQFRMQALLANSVGTRNVLDVAVKYQAKVLLASAATVYGNSEQQKTTVEESTLGSFDHLSPRGCFNEGKRFAETMVATYADVHGLDGKIARVFRTYGPRMPLFQGHQIPDFVLNILAGKSISIMGDDKTATSLVYVSDVVDGLMRLMRSPKGVGPVNFGSEEEIPIAEVAKILMRLCEQEVSIAYEPHPAHLIHFGLPSLNKAREKLGWLPLVRLEDGLRKTVDYIRANKLLLTASEKTVG